MDRQLKLYNHQLENLEGKDVVAYKERGSSIRSVLRFGMEQHTNNQHNHERGDAELNVQADMTRYDPQHMKQRVNSDSSNTESTRQSSSSGSPSLSPSLKISKSLVADSSPSRSQKSSSPSNVDNYQQAQEEVAAYGTYLNQAEYFCDDRSPHLASVQPSPSSQIATPPTLTASDQNHQLIATPPIFALPASAMIQSPTSVSTDNSMLLQQHPQLYSAIGSLEDPTNNSLRRWNREQATSKYEFPSNKLLMPPKSIKPHKQEPYLMHKVFTPSSTTNTATAAESETTKPSSPIQQKQAVNPTATQTKPSNLKKSKPPSENGAVETHSKTVKHVTISEQDVGKRPRSRGKKKGPLEMFRPSSDAYTPRMGKKEIKYKPAEMRTPVQTLATSLGTLQRPNFRDALRRVAMILHQHIVKIEQRFETKTPQGNSDNLFLEDMKDVFSEERFASSRYRCTMVRVPMARGGMVYGLKQIRRKYEIPTEEEIYEFGHQLFNAVQLSSECSIVCLIYVERLMEASKVPLLASTWRPIFMCGLLLASKVWQDLSSWNIEFANVYPQFSLDSINRLEVLFLRMIKWDLYISSSCYAKYYFALRSLVEKPDFRQRYNRMVGLGSVQASEALKIERRSSQVKEEAISQLSRSM